MGAAQRRVDERATGWTACVKGRPFMAASFCLPQGGWSVSTTMHLGRTDVATPVPRWTLRSCWQTTSHCFGGASV